MRVVLAAAAALVALGCGHHAPAPVKRVTVNEPGATVAIEAVPVAGYVTLVDFWSESCGACKVVEGKLAAAIDADARLVVRKIDVGDGLSAVARAYQVSALPHYKLFDRRRRLRYILVGNDCLRVPELAHELEREP
jgi:thiol-disulfide isomerase/thioredoxin